MTSQCHNSETGDGEIGVLNREITQQILDATRASVLAVGVRLTTLTDVARRAGVSRMTVYRLVPDVTTLILEVMSREFASLFLAAQADSRRRRRAGAAPLAPASPRRPRPSYAGCTTHPCSTGCWTWTPSCCCPI